MDYKAWFEKYRPRLFEDIVFPNEDISKTIEQFYSDGFIKGNILSYGPPGFGKAQPNSEPVLTPDGWKPMGMIKANDYVISADGSKTRVLGVFPQGKRDVYIIEFADGSKVRCDEEHIWLTWQNSSNKHKLYKTRTTKEMLEYKYGLYRTEKTKYDTIQKSMRWSVPLNNPVVYENKYNQIIPPFILGLLLGDGSFSRMGKKGNIILFSDKYFKHIEYLTEKLQLIFPDLKIKTYNGKDFIIQSKLLAEEIRKLGLANKKSIDKFIPVEYLYQNNPILRQQLMEGLLQTDGYKNGDVTRKNSKLKTYEFYSSSSLLISDFKALVSSLGIYTNPIRTKPFPKYMYRGKSLVGQPAYTVAINFAKKRKSITGIYKMDIVEEATCIMVENPSHLYITTGFTVTHNTTLSEVLIHRIVKDMNDIFILGRKTEDVDNLRRWLLQGVTGSKQKIVKIEEMDRLSKQAQIVLKDGLMEKYQHNVSFLATTNTPDKIDPALITRFNTKINFSQLPLNLLETRLTSILTAEKITFKIEDLHHFVESYGKRGLRDLINNLELASRDGHFNPEILSSFVGTSGSEDMIIEYIIYLIKYTESLQSDKILGIISNPKNEPQFYKFYSYVLTIFKDELRLNWEYIYQGLFDSDLDLSSKNIINDYWQDLDLKRFKTTHTVALINELIINIKEQQGFNNEQ